MKKVFRVLLAVSAILLCLNVAGCSKNAGKDSAQAGSTSKKIKLGVSAFPGWFVYYIAEGEKLFTKNGVEVELVWFPVYSDSIQAFNSGNLDMLCIALPDAVAPYLKGTEFKAVAINDFSNGADGLAAKSQYKTIQDLRGKKVATEYGTIEHFFLLKALETVGMKESDINLINISVGDCAPALIANAVDAACMWEPALSIALSSPENTLLYSSAQTPGLIQDLTIATDKLIRENPEIVTGVINAFLDAGDFYKINPDQCIEYMRIPAEVDAEQMKGVMSGGKIYGLKDMLSGLDGQQEGFLYAVDTAYENALFLKEVDLLDDVPQDRNYFRTMFDWSFLEAIAKTRTPTSGPDTSLK
ncbi:ABC transporter substrate-binding protein [Treponema primitia]|uniref:ABC transporter substrate-binding protein n=1 Tax=Treponema primitia TaxID=88058 RepID=UPI0002554CCC|nr:ABC transporter substrate-binding protein [Treponema primitia]